MNRTGLLICLAIAATVGIVFALYPELDITITRFFYAGGLRWHVLDWPSGIVREAASWIIALVAAPAFIALIAKWLMPRRPLLMPGRAMVLMISTLALGPGLAANVILKDNWARPRPQYVTEFGGPAPFFPWWDPRGTCDKNCSFVAGEPSGAFWTMSAAAVAPPQWRAAAYATAITFGAAVGLLRISAGGHFFTDVVFSGVVIFLLIWLVHGLLYRWRPTRLTDADIDRALERAATPGYDAVLRPGYDAVMRIAARLRGTASRG